MNFAAGIPCYKDYILYWKLNQLVSKFGCPDITLITQIFSKCILASHRTLFVWMHFIKALLPKIAWGMHGITEAFLRKRQIRESKGRTEIPVFHILMPSLMLISWTENKNNLKSWLVPKRTKLWQEDAEFLHSIRKPSSSYVLWVTSLQSPVTTVLSILRSRWERLRKTGTEFK